MAKRKAIRPHQLLLILVAIALGTALTAVAFTPYFTTEGYVKVDVLDVVGSSIAVGNNCTALIAETSQERADSIMLGLAGMIDTRPNAHDLFAETLKNFNITLERVSIDSFDGHWYAASMYMRSEDTVLKLDSKPSDAIAVAVRTHSPIYINATLLIEKGENIC